MTLLLLATLVSTATPVKRIDQAWGVLTRSTHLQGRWEITLDDGTRKSGDWIVINRDTYVTRDFGGGGGPHKAIHLVDSKSTTHCAFDAERPSHLYCVGGGVSNVRIPQGSTLSLDGATPLNTYSCSGGKSCGFAVGGTAKIHVKEVVPSLADEELLFERTTGETLAHWLGATTTRDHGVLVLAMPFRDVTRDQTSRTDAQHLYYGQDIVEATATIRIGPSPRAIAITADETARYVEDCQTSKHASSSCMMVIPVCKRRMATAR
jgi:hypothetical protein